MDKELINLSAFVGIACAWHWLDSKLAPHMHPGGWQWRRHIKWVVLAIAHPAVREGVKEFVIHVVVYSGMILGGTHG